MNHQPNIHVNNLSFDYQDSMGNLFPTLFNVNLDVMPGSAVVVIGANGAGKTTLLRVLAGKHLPSDRESVSVLGMPPFFQTLGNGISYLGNSMWTRQVAFVGSSVFYEADIPAGELLKDEQEKYKERRDELVALLEIDLNWRMHRVSDGQRRRVQIMLGLLQPFKVLLMDEVTVDLDCLVRADLLAYLKKQCVMNNSSVVYCTHIFDGLDGWPTHLLLVNDGRIQSYSPAPPNASIHATALQFLRTERQNRKSKPKTTTADDTKTFGSAAGWTAGRSRMDAYR